MITDLKWKLYTNSLDFTSRHKLTRRQLKNNLGLFAVWRGALPNGPQSVLTRVSYEISKDTEINETAFVVAILDLKDLLSLMEFSPDAVLALPSGEITSLKNKGALCGNKLACIEERVRNEYRKAKGQKEKWEPVMFYEQPLYDREVLNPGEYMNGSIAFFRTPLGGKNEHRSYWKEEDKSFSLQTWVKHQRDTNMDVGGSLPYPKTFNFNGYSLIPDLDSDPEDFKRLVNACWFRFFVGTMDRHNFPAQLVAGLSDAGQEKAIKLSTPAGPHYELSDAHELISQQNFRAEINLSGATEPLVIKKPLGVTCILWGHFSRKVH
jgi:hypothetical protein